MAFSDSIGWSSVKNGPRLSILDRIAGGLPQEHTYSAPLGRFTVAEPHPHALLHKHPIRDRRAWQRRFLRDPQRVSNRDYYRVFYATPHVTPIALLFGMLAVTTSAKWVDDLIQYVYTVLDSIPSILLLVVLLLVLGRGVTQICIALGITSWVGLCRLTRGETLKHRDRDYVRAARALGLSHGRILLRHILPNLLPVVIITATLGISNNILAETILSYLQLGVPSDIGSWGNMIDGARTELARDPVIWWDLVSAIGGSVLPGPLRQYLRRRFAGPASIRGFRGLVFMDQALLQVDNLRTCFNTPGGTARAVDGVSFAVERGKTLAIVGESGCGKSITALSIMQLVPEPAGYIETGRVMFEGKDLLDYTWDQMRVVRGKDIAMIFQEPMTSLNPVQTVGWQLVEAMAVHNTAHGGEAVQRAVESLDRVGLANPTALMRRYPHELSGGMRQRVMIAMALSNPDPKLLIADEPTVTALDASPCRRKSSASSARCKWTPVCPSC